MSDSYTIDAFLDGRVRVVQPRKGFRAGTDSVLLAAAIDPDLTGTALELGCGAGGALLPASACVPNVRFTGVERDPVMADLARRGVAENDLGARVEIVDGDAKAVPPDWQNMFDCVFSNPPFFSAGSIQTPGEGKGGAYLESLPLKDWINAMLFALRPKGTFLMIHRAAELARILGPLERQAGDICVLPVRSFPGADAKRVLVRARKGLRPGPMRLLAGIDLYERKGGERTSLCKALTYDGARINWSSE